MNFVQSIKDAWEIVTLKERTIKKVAHDKDSWISAVLIILIAGVSGSIGSLIAMRSGFAPYVGAMSAASVIFMPLIGLVMSVIVIGLLHIIAKILGGKATFKQFYSTMGHATLLSWASLITYLPFIGILFSIAITIWSLIADYFVIKTVQQLSTARAIWVLAIPLILMAIIVMIMIVFFLVTLASGISPLPLMGRFL